MQALYLGARVPAEQVAQPAVEYYLEKSSMNFRRVIPSVDKRRGAKFHSLRFQKLINSFLIAIIVAASVLASNATLTHPEALDVLLGWSLMGDPALAINP